MDSAKRSCGGRATLRACRPGAQRPCSRWSARRARLACNGIPCRAVGPIGIRCAPPDAARNGRALWKAAPRWRKGGRHSGGMLWGMGQMGPVLVSVSFTLNSVTKLNSVNPRARAEHLDTVLRAPAQGGRAEVRARTPSGEARRHIKTGRSHPHVSRMCKL